MTVKFFGKICKCLKCGWIGPYSEVRSMAGYEFCPVCKHGYCGFMPEHEEKPAASQPAHWVQGKGSE